MFTASAPPRPMCPSHSATGSAIAQAAPRHTAVR
jgi:hypothetical protein